MSCMGRLSDGLILSRRLQKTGRLSNDLFLRIVLVLSCFNSVKTKLVVRRLWLQSALDFINKL